MVKSIMIDDQYHNKLLNIQDLIYKETRFNMSLGNIVSRWLDNDPDEIVKDIIRVYKEKQV
jgi:hypothetical protein